MKKKTTITIQLDAEDLHDLKRLIDYDKEPQTQVIRKMIRSRARKLPPEFSTDEKFLTTMTRQK